jgi:hypothetical protein
MSQQYNKVEKRRRRTAYLRRLKARQKKKSGTKAAKITSAASAN